MPGSLLANDIRPQSPATPPVSDHDAAKPIPNNIAQDEGNSPAEKGIGNEEKAQYANKMLRIISNTLAKYDTDAASWELESLARFVDALKHARNASQRYYNVRRPQAKPTVFKLENETKEAETTALLNAVREALSGEEEVDVAMWSPLRLSAFYSCITETFDVILALYNDKKDCGQAEQEVKQETRADGEKDGAQEEEKLAG